MSKSIKVSLLATAVAAAMAFSGMAGADPLAAVQQEAGKGNAESAASQQKIDGAFEQSQELLAEYRALVDEVDNLKVYNDHVQRLVDDQTQSLNSFQRQIDSIEKTKQGVVPLMYHMIDTLDQFIVLDVPVNLDERKKRVADLRKLMDRSDVTTSEKYRQVLEAYLVENEYGTKIAAYQGELEFEGQKLTVDYFHLGRAVFVAQSLDQKHAWAWTGQGGWLPLEAKYLSPITTAIRMARKQAAFDLVGLPVLAAERVK
ncbi:MAG: DUF3450 domain-containing protein [Gammaproteobacteria bacterium]|nr:DUF3450 domain-containing protein [Gammaproteobacteria bacterium]